MGAGLPSSDFKYPISNFCSLAKSTTFRVAVPLFCLPSSATGGGRQKTSFSPAVGLKYPERGGYSKTPTLACNKKFLGQKTKEFFCLYTQKMIQLRRINILAKEIPFCKTITGAQVQGCTRSS